MNVDKSFSKLSIIVYFVQVNMCTYYSCSKQFFSQKLQKRTRKIAQSAKVHNIKLDDLFSLWDLQDEKTEVTS